MKFLTNYHFEQSQLYVTPAILEYDWFSIKASQLWQERRSNPRPQAKKYADYNTAPPLLNWILMILLLMRENIYIRTYGISSYKQFNFHHQIRQGSILSFILNSRPLTTRPLIIVNCMDYNRSCQWYDSWSNWLCCDYYSIKFAHWTRFVINLVKYEEYKNIKS